MNTRRLIATFFLLFCAFPFSAYPRPLDALQALFRSSKGLRTRVISPEGWANRWFRARLGQYDANWSKTLATLPDEEADAFLSQILLTDKARRVFAEVRTIDGSRVDLHAGEIAAEKVWPTLFEYSGTPGGEIFHFASTSPRQALHRVRDATKLEPHLHRFPSGGVGKWWTIESPRGAFWANVNGDVLHLNPSSLARRLSLTQGAKGPGFSMGSKGLAVMGNRFSVVTGKEGSAITECVGNEIRFYKPTGGRRGTSRDRGTLLTAGDTSEARFLTLGEQLGEDATRWVALAKVEDAIALYSWSLGGPKITGKSVPYKARTISPALLGDEAEGAIVTGVRFSNLKSVGDEPIVAVDYIGSQGAQKTGYFKFSDLEPATLGVRF